MLEKFRPEEGIGLEEGMGQRMVFQIQQPPSAQDRQLMEESDGGRRDRWQLPVNVDKECRAGQVEQWVRFGFTSIQSARTGTFLDLRTGCEIRSQKPR